MKTFFKKLEYCFLVESTKIENATFPYKTALSEANRMGSTKLNYQKERSFASILFRKLYFRIKTSYNSWFDVPTTQTSMVILFVSAEVLSEGAFSP